MTTYKDPNSDVPQWLQSLLGKASAGIPLWDYHQTPYRDEFGQTEKSGLAERVIENLFSPGYWTSANNDPVVKMLRTVYEKTGDTPFPDEYAKGSFTNNGKKYTLYGEENNKYTETVGQAYHDGAEKVLNSGALNGVKRDMLEDVLKAAREAGKADYLKDHGVSYQTETTTWDKAMKALDSNGIALSVYYEYMSKKSALTWETNVPGAKKAATMGAINSLKLNNDQKDYLYLEEGYAASTLNEAPWHKRNS